MAVEIKEKAKFIGTDGILGLRKGSIYNISLVKQTDYPLMIRIEDVGICPYKAIVDFLGNWEMILPEESSYFTFYPTTKQCEAVRPFTIKPNNHTKFKHV